MLVPVELVLLDEDAAPNSGDARLLELLGPGLGMLLLLVFRIMSPFPSAKSSPGPGA